MGILTTLGTLWVIFFEQQEISWGEFVRQLLQKGEVSNIVIDQKNSRIIIHTQKGAQFNGAPAAGFYWVGLPDLETLEMRIRQEERKMGIPSEDFVPIGEADKSAMMLTSLPVITLFIYFTFMVAMWLARRFKNNVSDISSIMALGSFKRADLTVPGQARVRMEDVAGLHEAKIEIMEFVEYLRDPLRYKRLGAKLPRGALLLGPPGCGKTLLCRAMAAEAGVPFLYAAGSEFENVIGGLGAKRVRELFKKAREWKSCIVFIDELDAIGRKRGGRATGGGSHEQTLNQLLVEMDGMTAQENLIVFAATNRDDVLDKALLRPGRFDRHIAIDLPTLIERQELFELYLKKIKLEGNLAEHAITLARMTPQLSGADIANVVNEAAVRAVRHEHVVVQTSDLERALERITAGSERKTHSLTDTERKHVAVHEAGHVVLAWHLEHVDPILKVSVAPRTSSVLSFTNYMPEDKKLYSTEDLFDRMCLAYGGHIAEMVMFNAHTTQAQDDLKKITDSAYRQIREFGMNERVGHVSFPKDPNFLEEPFSQTLGQIIDEEVRKLLLSASQHARKIIESHQDQITAVADALFARETLSHEELVQLIGQPDFARLKPASHSLLKDLEPSDGVPAN